MNENTTENPSNTLQKPTQKKTTLSRREFIKLGGIVGTGIASSGLFAFLSRGESNRHHAQSEMGKTDESSRLPGLAEIKTLSKEQMIDIISQIPVLPVYDKQTVSNVIVRGKEKGMDSRSIIVLGSSVPVEADTLLGVFGEETSPDLSGREDLKETVNYFAEGTTNRNLQWGINVGADVYETAQDSMWCYRGECKPGETVQQMMIRMCTPVASLIFVGTNAFEHTLEDYEVQLQKMISEQIDSGVLPIFTTFPQPFDESDPFYGDPDKAKLSGIDPTSMLRINLLISHVCEINKIPLVNLVGGLKNKPNLEYINSFHPKPPDQGGFSLSRGDTEKYSSSYVDLLLLETLDKLRKDFLFE